MPLTYNDIKEELRSAIYGDYRATILWTRLHEKGSGYEDAYAYAIRVGTVTGNILRKYQPEDLADWDLENLIPGTLGLNHNMVVAACREAQRNLNAMARIGILPQLPDFDGNRAFGLVEAVRKRGKIGSSFYDQVTNFDLNVVDQSVRKNAEFQFSAGLNPKIVRTAASKCCEWCDKLAGTYDYYKISNTGNPVWRRHDNCRCLILYNPGDGSKRRQNVHTKRWTEENKADRIASAGRQGQLRLDLQMFAHKTGDYRRMMHGQEWDELSLKDTLSKYARGSKPVKSQDKQKISYFSKDGRYEVKYDVKGDYFRIIDRQSESHLRPCLDKNGNPVLNIVENGKQRSATDEEYKRLTHFKNSDTKGVK